MVYFERYFSVFNNDKIDRILEDYGERIGVAFVSQLSNQLDQEIMVCRHLNYGYIKHSKDAAYSLFFHKKDIKIRSVLNFCGPL